MLAGVMQCVGRSDAMCWQERCNVLAGAMQCVGRSDAMCWQERCNVLAGVMQCVGRSDAVRWQERCRFIQMDNLHRFFSKSLWHSKIKRPY